MKLKLHTQPEVPTEAESITPAIINSLKYEGNIADCTIVNLPN